MSGGSQSGQDSIGVRDARDAQGLRDERTVQGSPEASESQGASDGSPGIPGASEPEAQRPSDKSGPVLRWIIGTAGRRVSAEVIAITAFESVIALSVVLSAVVLQHVVDAAVAGNANAFVLGICLFALIIVVQIGCRAVIRRLNEAALAHMENALKGRIYRVLLGRDYLSLREYHTGELQNRLTNDTKVVAEGYASILPGVFGMAVKLVAASVVLISIDWRFAIILIALGIVLLFVTYGFRRMMKRLHKKVQSADGTVRSFLQETLESLLVIRSFSGEELSARTADGHMESHYEARMKRNTVSNICNTGFSVVMRGGYLLGLIWCGFGILNGTMSYGTLVAVLQLVNQIQGPFANISGYLPRYYNMIASAERLIELEKLPADGDLPCASPTDADAANAADAGLGAAPTQCEDPLDLDACRMLYEQLESIDVRDLTFSFPDLPVLDHAAISIPKASFTAIAGSSGIGKSTLLKLMIAVLVPQGGSLALRMRDGSMRPLSRQTRRLFAYVPQGNFLLSGTLREAVCFFEDACDEDRLNEALRIACADEFVAQLPKGLDTTIGEHGAGLSEGQIQRLAVARALYSGAPILLLDESTSALDESNEARLLENLRSMTDRTLVVVTHRRAALDLCDKVVTLQGGHFVENSSCASNGVQLAP